MQRPGIQGAWPAGDAGGAEELQTDVMRFVAILALCLVAIFALVQSVPLETPVQAAAPSTAAEMPVQESAPSTAAEMPVQESAPAPAAAAPVQPPPVTARAAPPRLPAADARRTPAPGPAPAAAAAAPEAAPAAVPDRPSAAEPALPAATAGADRGFTLRFESDDALTALVARREIGFYAVGGEEARRLQVAEGRLEFWRSSMPASFHEMDPGTVPAEVAAALAKSGHGAGAVRFGVTLPPRLSREIDRRLAAGGSGDLVIAASGTLRQE